MNPNQELFNNNAVDLASLPAAEQLVTIPLEPAYKTVRYLSAGITALILVVVCWMVFFLQPRFGIYGLAGALLITLISVLIVLYSSISYKYMGYAIREKDITYKSGWLWKSMTTVPFNRVQHCDIRQGILDRRFGLSRLTIYTAGGQSTDLMIPGLLPDTAEKLKVFILNSTEQSVENS